MFCMTGSETDWGRLSDGARLAASHFGEHIGLAFKRGRFQTLPWSLEPALTVNAAAVRRGSDSAAFLFHIGLGYALIDVFSTLISQSDFYSDVPLAKGSVRAGPPAPGRFYDYSWLLPRDGSQPPGFFIQESTSDASRHGLGDHLLETAAQFVALHEQAHHVMGHLSFLGQENQRLTFYEIPRDIQGAAYAETVRALELEADMHAASLLFNAGRNPASRRAAHFKQLHTTLDWDRSVMVAVAVVFMLIALSESHSSVPPELRTHPPAAVRTISIFKFYDHLVRAEIGSGGLGQQAWLARVLEDMATAARITGVLPMTLADLLGAALEEADRTPAVLEEERTTETLERLRPSLDPHLKRMLAWMNVPAGDFQPESRTQKPERRGIPLTPNFLKESDKRGGVSQTLKQLLRSGKSDLTKGG
jgi:hypothetical protein